MSFCRGMIIISVILASVSTTLPPPLHAQGTTGTIRGIVTRSTPDAPVAGAQVFIVGGRLGAVTGADGRYTFSQVPPGTHVVRVRALGFQPIEKSVEVSGGQAATADFDGNGAVGFEDLVALAQNYNLSGGGLSPGLITSAAASFAADWALHARL